MADRRDWRFALNDLLATYRSRPLVGKRSWLWERFFGTFGWNRTGGRRRESLRSDGGVEHGVVVGPKIRACLRNEDITDVLYTMATGRKPADGRSSLQRQGPSDAPQEARSPPWLRRWAEKTAQPPVPSRRAIDHRHRRFRQQVSADDECSRACGDGCDGAGAARHPQCADPQLPPRVVGPGSPSPYYLWVSLDTKRPEAFVAELNQDSGRIVGQMSLHMAVPMARRAPDADESD